MELGKALHMDKIVSNYSKESDVYARILKCLEREKNLQFLQKVFNYLKILYQYTDNKIPCGVLEEIGEIEKLISRYYDGDYNRNFYVFNLLGYGSIMMSSNPRNLENIELVQREIMESKVLKKI